MKLFKKIMALIIGGLFLNCADASDKLTLYDINHKPVSLEQLKGKWVILNYWAGWCEACMSEVSELNKFNQDIKDKNIVFYGINYDQLDGAELKASVAEAGITFPILVTDPSQELNLDDIDAIPTTFIVNPKGQVVKKMTGPNTESSLMQTLASLQR